MGKTKRKNDYNNFVDTDKNNLIVIKPRKIVEQVRTFEGEEGFVVPKNNTYIDKGLIVNINDHDESAIDVVGVSDSLYSNAGGQITGTANVTPSQNGIYVQLSGGQQPYSNLTYQFGSSTGTQQGTPSGNQSFGLNANYNAGSACYQGGSYGLHVSGVDANGDNISWSWYGILQGTCTTGTQTQPLSGLTANASLVGTNDVKCDATWSNGTAPFSVTIEVYKDGNLINTINQTPTGNISTYTATNVANGNYKFLVKVTDNTNANLTISTNTINVNVASAPTSQPLSGLTANATLIANDDIKCDASWSNGTAPYSVKYLFYKDGNLVSTTPKTTNSTTDSFTAQTNSNAGNYNFVVEVTDSANVTKTATSQTITLQSNVVTTTSLPISGLSLTTTIVGNNNNDLKCDASWINGLSPFTITYSLYKNGVLQAPIAPLTSNSNSTTYTATGLADGNYQFQVVVSDSQGSKNATSQLINIVNATASTGTTGQTGGATNTTTTTTTPPPTTTTTTTPSSPTIVSGGVVEKPIFLERETIIEAETFYSKNKLPIWLLIAIGVYFIATNKSK